MYYDWLTSNVIRRFWKFVKIAGEDECWIWQGARDDKNRYGQLWVSKKITPKAHQVAFCLFNGDIDPSLQILHSCDNPPCVNPKHLSQGTAQDNSTDAVNKGRIKHGEDHGRARVTEAQVIDIRASYKPRVVTAKALAEKYSLPFHIVRKIIWRETWRYLP